MWYSLLLLGYKPVRHVTVLNTAGSCNAVVIITIYCNVIILTYNIILVSCALHFGLNYEINYQLDAVEYLFEFFQLDMFRAYMPIFRSNGCYNFFTYVAYGVLGLVWCRS